MYFFNYPSTAIVVTHALIVVAITVRVIMRRPATGVALAWLFLVALLPFVGALIYFLIGERRIGRKRRARDRHFADRLQENLRCRDPGGPHGRRLVASRDRPRGHGPARATNRGQPHRPRQQLQLFSDTQEVLHTIAREVDQAESSILMEFYIWNEGGRPTRSWRPSSGPLKEAFPAVCWWMRSAPSPGGKASNRAAQRRRRPFTAALPVGVFRTLFGRTDLRLHRKSSSSTTRRLGRAA